MEYGILLIFAYIQAFVARYWPVALILSLFFLSGMMTGIVVVR